MNSDEGIADEISLDASDAPILMPKRSKYAGTAVDKSSRRSLVIIPSQDDGEPIGTEASHAIVDYFYHAGQFWRASIPLSGVENVYGQAFNFSKPKTRQSENGPEILLDKHGLPRRTISILNHLQTRFTLKSDQPVELYPLNCEQFAEPVHRIHDIIYSLEATGPVGVNFNLRDGLAGNLLSTHRFMSIEEMVFERIVVENQYVTESPSLPISEHEKRELLIGSLRRSHRAGMTERYYLYRVCGTNNCTSSPFQIVDRVVKYRWTQWLGSALYRLPLNPRLYLWVRGLDSDPSCHKLLRTEFHSFIGESSVQQRKRDYVRQQIRIRRAARGSQE